MKTAKTIVVALLMAATNLVCAQGLKSNTEVNKSAIEKNKVVVIRFNKEYWESGNLEIVKELLAGNYVNHFAPPNGPNDARLMVQFITGFRKGFQMLPLNFTKC